VGADRSAVQAYAPSLPRAVDLFCGCQCEEHLLSADAPHEFTVQIGTPDRLLPFKQ
jgi:hypothetical protein